MNNFTEMCKSVARSYDDVPNNPTVTEALGWAQLEEDTRDAYERLISAGFIIKPVSGQPYACADDMFRDIEQMILRVSTDNLDHPIWGEVTQFQFRAVHDIMGHFAGRGDSFDWYGEVKAWEAHEKTVSGPLAKAALFTETIGQAAYALVNKGFGDQKCGFLPQWQRFWLSSAAL